MFERWLSDKHGDLAQAALTLPILILVSLGLVNLALFGIAGMNATNAANYGARIGSVNQNNPAWAARQAALSKLNAASIGEYSVSVSHANGTGRGSLLQVRVTYSVPNYLRGLAALYGGKMSPRFTKSTVSYFRMEGW